MDVNLDTISAWAKRKGFVYPGSEIYGGLSNAWDFGPYGVQLKNNIRDLFWKEFVQKRTDVIGLDAQIIMNRTVWQASGHEKGFNDPLMDCKKCKNRFRADKLIEEYIEKSGDTEYPNNWAGEGTPLEDLEDYISQKQIKCPECGALDYTNIRKFNLMFKTHQGVVESDENMLYLRPETCQGIFVDYKNILNTTRMRVPFGVAQIGKAFRNEITPGQFIYRQREFEQMEIEYFVHPDEAKDYYQHWMDESYKRWCDILQIPREKMEARKLPDEEAAHYADSTHDFEFKFPWGWGEVQALNNRTNYDLKNHQEHSGVDLQYSDPKTGERYIPYVIEVSMGLSRTTFVAMANAYDEETYTDPKGNEQSRVVVRFPFDLAPVKYAVLPLMEKNEDMVKKGKEVFAKISDKYLCEFDTSGNIGKRYRRQDEIGTPYCVTIDHQTLEDGTVTIRNRDDMTQQRVKIEDII
ncbi:glycine--tRNA ligase [Candidatus Absconditicoccus praedator]|uniref:glycine--tRNA ligase n=1 Tax=Candidatus Absconditicoccus praedator TaxID=2735562 RepID=UPI001E2B4B7A|nr:glycine--tRNA ligase [Candidatus Absconditicoccus praedator]UFX82679.1 glycine--tRNA ligase [Candidatus Absconditicoccus praedator]